MKTSQSKILNSHVTIENYLPEIGNDEIVKSILNGLLCENKYISSLFFYDETGSKLFEEITRLPEYYIPAIEKQLIKETAHYLKESLNNVDIIEFGSGDCSKISVLLEDVPPRSLSSIRYIPVDVSHSAIEETVNILPRTFPELKINGILADFVKQVNLIPNGSKNIFCLFGSTIGNFNYNQAKGFCSAVSKVMQPEDIFLLGMDMVKDPQVLFKAYNDSRNVTSEFNKNILKVINKYIGSDFNPQDFDHLAFFNKQHSRIEMHLKAVKDIEANSPHTPRKIRLTKGETIHTENSYKFSNAQIEELGKASRLKPQRLFTDKNNWFTLAEYVKG